MADGTLQIVPSAVCKMQVQVFLGMITHAQTVDTRPFSAPKYLRLVLSYVSLTYYVSRWPVQC